MTNQAADWLAAKQREQTPQALARLVVIGLFVGVWAVFWLLRMPMPVPFLVVLGAEALFMLAYWRVVFLVRTAGAIQGLHYFMLAAEIAFHTTMVYFLGGVAWLGAFAYVFGLIFTTAFLDLRRAFIYTLGVTSAFSALILLEANGVIPHQVYLEEGPLRFKDARLVATTIVGSCGVFFSIYAWVNWVGHQLRRERDVAIRTQMSLMKARAALELTNEELEHRVRERTAALEQATERLRAVVTNAPVVLFALDEHGNYTYAEGSGLEAAGTDSERIVGVNAYEAFAGQPEVIRELSRVYDGEPRTVVVPVRDAVFESRMTPLRDERGRIVGVTGVAVDISERTKMEQALRESETKFRSLAEMTEAAIFITQDGKFCYVNPAAERMSGFTRDELLAMEDGAELVHPDFATQWTEEREERRRKSPQQNEIMIRTKSGDAVWLQASVGEVLFDGRPARLGTAFDITERKFMEDRLRDQAQRDSLTGVLNHASIMAELRAQIAAAKEEDGQFAIAMLDVDDMKITNDTYGHPVGDDVLRTLAEAIARPEAIIGRYGGDEFLIILPHADRAEAESYRSGLLAKMSRSPVSDPESGASIPIVVSVGLAVYPTEAGQIEELVQLADNALYASRRARRGQPAEGPPHASRGDHAAEIVGQIVPLLTSSEKLDEKLRLVAHRLSVGAGYDAVNFSLIGPEAGAPAAANTFARAPDELVDAWNRDQRAETEERHPAVLALERTKRPIIIQDPANDPLLLESQREILKAAGFRCVLVAPMLWENEVVGTLGVAGKRENAFGSRDAQFLMAVATQVTAIIRMASLVEELQVSSDQLVAARDETVMMLAAVAEAHDHTTGSHLHRVRAVTEALALELGHSTDEAQRMALAAVLHDIGKIRVPASILASSGTLVEEEWALMKHHTTWGGLFLSDRPGFELAATIARHHHERWDGTGYPYCLKGHEIPEAATIVAVADAFDAITSERPYRNARSAAAAVREIKTCAGTQFSPAVVEALVRLYREDRLPTVSPPAAKKAA